MFTIIVATFNAEHCLNDLFLSLRNQQNGLYELIVIDGKSSDSTIDIIKKHDEIISFWISEPDKGIYDAWNKGVVKATNKWIMFLGADDKLMPNALQTYQSYLNKRTETDQLHLLSSKRQMVNKDGKLIRVTGYCWEWPLFLKFMTVSHPGSLHSKLLFDKYGLFNTTYKIAGDYELLLRPRGKLKAEFINEVTVSMSEGGASDSIAAIKEYYRAARSTGGGNRYYILKNAIITVIKLILKRLFRQLGINLYLKK